MSDLTQEYDCLCNNADMCHYSEWSQLYMKCQLYNIPAVLQLFGSTEVIKWCDQNTYGLRKQSAISNGPPPPLPSPQPGGPGCPPGGPGGPLGPGSNVIDSFTNDYKAYTTVNASKMCYSETW